MCTDISILKEGIYGSWDENPNKKHNGPLLASEFFVLWPFLAGVVNEMPVKRRIAIQSTIKGSTARVVRGLVKHFNLLKCGYPIHMSKTRPLLKMSSVVDAEMLQVQSKMKQQCQQLIKSGKKEALQFMKGNGILTPLCHMYVDNEEVKAKRRARIAEIRGE